MERNIKIETIIIDTGIIYALADQKDAWHKRSVDFVESFNGRLIITSTVLPEAGYLINKFLGWDAEMMFINSLANRELLIEHFDVDDLKRCVEILNKYSDADFGFVDSSLMAIAERMNVRNILTTDRRHFSIVRPAHCKSFTLLP
ncbi:MAG: PIN domain-containing protein [Planctomycetes bacterium]|nr:PIN domain-containing protein [Planctomycetota bacterium]